MIKLRMMIKPAIILIAIPSVPAFIFSVWLNLAAKDFPSEPDSQHPYLYHINRSARYISNEMYSIQQITQRIMFFGWPIMIILGGINKRLEDDDKEARIQNLLGKSH
jgi:hypothetical protein